MMKERGKLNAGGQWVKGIYKTIKELLPCSEANIYRYLFEREGLLPDKTEDFLVDLQRMGYIEEKKGTYLLIVDSFNKEENNIIKDNESTEEIIKRERIETMLFPDILEEKKDPELETMSEVKIRRQKEYEAYMYDLNKLDRRDKIKPYEEWLTEKNRMEEIDDKKRKKIKPKN